MIGFEERLETKERVGDWETEINLRVGYVGRPSETTARIPNVKRTHSDSKLFDGKRRLN